MQIDPQDLTSVVTRLKRVQGQLGGIVRMIEEGRDCAEVLTQFAAASRGLDRAGFKIIATGMRQCMSDRADGKPTLSDAQMEKLFLSLA